jgi:hypothetical protein
VIKAQGCPKAGSEGYSKKFHAHSVQTLQRAIEAAERAIQDEIAAEEKAAPFD